MRNLVISTVYRPQLQFKTMETLSEFKKTTCSRQMPPILEGYGYMARLGLANPNTLAFITPITIPNYATNGGMVTKARRTLSWMTSVKSTNAQPSNSKSGETDTAVSQRTKVVQCLVHTSASQLLHSILSKRSFGKTSLPQRPYNVGSKRYICPSKDEPTSRRGLTHMSPQAHSSNPKDSDDRREDRF